MPEPMIVANAGKGARTLLPALANRHGLVSGASGRGGRMPSVFQNCAG